jgi:lipopolysaccharide export system protein LptA
MTSLARNFTRACRRGALAAALAAMALSGAAAQNGSGSAVPNPLQGFTQNRGEPIEIQAAKLEVRDKQRIATFTGNVKVVQGDTTMRCKSLVVFYEPEGSQSGVKAATPGPGGSQQISKLEARGGVIVTQLDNTATGETALFDVRSNTVTLIGNVVVTQGPNIVRGERLVVDMTTGVSRVDAGKSLGPVRMLIHQNPQQQTPNGQAATPPPAGPPGLPRLVPSN